MLDSELTTFGMVIKFSLELEQRCIELYERFMLLDDSHDSSLKDHQRRVRILEDVRREKLNEIMLEPIAGLTTADYNLSIDLADDADAEKLRQELIRLEEQSGVFYRDISQKVKSFSREITRIVERMAKENHKLLGRITQ